MLKDNYNHVSNVPNPSIKKGTIKEKLIIFLERNFIQISRTFFKGKVNESEEKI